MQQSVRKEVETTSAKTWKAIKEGVKWSQCSNDMLDYGSLLHVGSMFFLEWYLAGE